ncbi:MAG: hypothetical protein V4580_08565 [Bacteroidota bacterium]
MKIIYLQKNNYLAYKLTAVALLVYTLSYAQSDSCAFFGDKIIYPYYHPAPPTNGKDFYTLKKEFRNAITAQTTFNGIITVNFFINYKGETNYYRTQVCDLNYLPLSVTEEIEPLCSQILETIKHLSPWNPPYDDKKNPINIRKFYSFRFNNGTLIEILPK